MKPTFADNPEISGWFHDQYRMARVRGSRWMVAAICGWLIAAGALFAIATMLPLQKIQPWVVTVDTGRGLVTSLQPVEDVQSLTEKTAIVQSNLYRYVIACESYDPALDLNRAYDICRNMSDVGRRREFDNEVSPNNPNSPANTLKTGAKRRVDPISIVPVGKDIAQVRFEVVEMRNGVVAAERIFSAVVKYKFTREPAAPEDRWENPLGFKVNSYTKVQEASRTDR